MKNKAFTLTELIIALGIIGTIAALSVPALMNNINRKVLSTQIKNTAASIQQLITDQMVTKRAIMLKDTDFGNVSLLLKNFSKIKDCSSTSPCWADSYGFIGGAAVTQTEEDEEDEEGTGGEEGSETPALTVSSDVSSIRLRNGVAIGYKLVSSDDAAINGEKILGQFYVDANATDSPNIIGRDFFSFYVTTKGHIVGGSGTCASATDIDGGLKCFEQLVKNNWKMPEDSDY
ncbi:type II secretion system protein [bacterium]|nr:type II secretion system protein [bacterium]